MSFRQACVGQKQQLFALVIADAVSISTPEGVVGRGEPEQLFRTHHWVFEPGFVFVRVVEFIQLVHFKTRVRRSEILCVLQKIKIIADLFGCKKPPDLPDKVRHLRGE